MAFDVEDTIRKIGKPELCTAKEARPAQDLYWMQLGTDFATREWAKGSDLELVASARKPDI